MKRSKTLHRKFSFRAQQLVFGGISFVLALVIMAGINTSRKTPCANSISCEKSLEFIVNNGSLGVFESQQFVPPVIDLSEDFQTSRVRGAATASGEKHIYVDLTKQHLYAYEGSDLYMDTPISSGKWFPTPTGEFSIWLKVRSTRMTGGVGADYYDLPNVPFNMFFYNDSVVKSRGFALHGAYWHDNFGHPMSHGCVNLRQIDAEKLYEWTDPLSAGPTIQSSAENPGTKVTIYTSADKQ